ncbi:hypothetical protein AX14_005380 [Amanita brunnescens Koide BX004]|nr:hypothetical protein AX14_005380 [Amanita brunnescens Koide BX004]
MPVKSSRCVFTLPFLQRNISQLEQHLEIVSGDASTLYNAVTLSSNDLAPQHESLPSQFQLTNADLQQCINDLEEIQSINSTDAAMVLKIIQDFEPKFTGTLDKLQGKKFFFERLGTITIILEQLKALQSNMANLMWKLVKALPAQYQGDASSIQANMGAEFYKTILLYSSK